MCIDLHFVRLQEDALLGCSARTQVLSFTNSSAKSYVFVNIGWSFLLFSLSFLLCCDVLLLAFCNALKYLQRGLITASDVSCLLHAFFTNFLPFFVFKSTRLWSPKLWYLILALLQAIDRFDLPDVHISATATRVLAVAPLLDRNTFMLTPSRDTPLACFFCYPEFASPPAAAIRLY